MKESIRKLGIVLWKNYLIRKRHKFLTVIEIIIPVVLFFFVSYARARIPDFSKQYVNESTIVQSIPANDIYTRLNIRELNVLYAPKTEFTKNLLRQVQLKLNLYNEGVRGFKNEEELMAHYNKQDGEGVTAAIIFSNVGNLVPTKLNYDIKMYEEHVFWNTDQLFLEVKEYVPGIGSEVYKDKGFLPLQMALDMSFFELVNKNNSLISLSFQEFPYPPYTIDSGLSTMFIHALPILTLFSYLFLWPSILRRIIEEKSSGIKELMKVNGLEPWMLWTSWFIYGFVLNIISAIFIVLFLKVKLWDQTYPAIQYCNAFVLGLYLILYCSASISFCFTFSTLFNRPNLAMIVGILFWIILYLLYSKFARKMDVLTWFLKIPTLLFPNIALHYGYQAISMFELREIHLNFGNLFESPTGSSNDVSMGNILLMLLLDTVIFFMLSIYFDNLFPGRYGFPKKWSYPLMNLNMCLQSFLKIFKKFQDSFNKVVQINVQFKSDKNVNLVPKIKIQMLKKAYGNKTVVNDLTVDIYERQITGLLGHNGAGKTTTISILTGMIDATSGRILIRKGNDEEVDLKENFDSLRRMLSVCPQHNMVFPDLTVLEHLKFFGMLRGKSSAEAHTEAKALLHDKLHLLHKKNKFAHTLSGGMKRKLALGMALMGDPEILILDEPTAGIDIESRRELWDLILSYKKKKTIILTTHFMEEADYLADRIAIMNHGNLITYETPMNLKLREGHYLTVNRMFVKKDDHREADDINRDVEEVMEKIAVLMTEFEARCECTDNTNKITYKYHLSNDKKSKFTELLGKIENLSAEIKMRYGEELGVLSFKLSHKTLEDVYLSLSNKVENTVETKFDGFDCEQQEATTWRRFKTLIKKRALLIHKDMLLLLSMVFVSSLIIWLVFKLSGNGLADTSKDGPMLNLDLNVYGETGVYYSTSGEYSKKIDAYYKQLIRERGSIPMKVNNVEGEIVKKGIENVAYYKQRMIVGARFMHDSNTEHVGILYSNSALHGAPISLNLVMNTMLKMFAGDEYSIQASNTPLHSVEGKQTRLEQSGIVNLIMWLVLFPLAPLVIVSYIILFTHAEESSNMRRLQHNCGVSTVLYWMTNLIWDVLYYLVAVFLALFLVSFLVLLSAVFQVDLLGNYSLFGGVEIGMLVLILLVYTCSIPWAYWTGYMHKTVESAYSSFLLLNISVFPIVTVCILVMEISGDSHYENVAGKLRWIFAVFPQFSLTYMSAKFSAKFIQNHNWDVKSEKEKSLLCSYDSLPCCDPDSVQCMTHRSYFNDLGYLISTVIAACMVFLVLMGNDFIHFWLKKLFLRFHGNKDAQSITPSKSDVNVIRKKNENKTEILDVQHIEQKYFVPNIKLKWKEIIKGISFKVAKGECFGLLGVNGAGKSTTFRMLAREERESRGRITSSEENIEEKMGYCPQQDSLINELTGRELLTIFANLRGLHSAKDCVQKWFTVLDMLDYVDQPCGTYSGGNKRKLNTCLSLIGIPPLVILDEPTSGVDPKSRRTLWNVLKEIKAQQKTALVLSSHSMDECEALCDKLVIIKDGTIKKEVTVSELQQEEAGFTVKIKLKNDLSTLSSYYDDTDHVKNSENQPLNQQNNNTIKDKEKPVISDLEQKFDHFEVIDKNQSMLHIQVKKMNWRKTLKCLEDLKSTRSDIEDYSISNTSLEELFLNIAKDNTPLEDPKDEQEQQDKKRYVTV